MKHFYKVCILSSTILFSGEVFSQTNNLNGVNARDTTATTNVIITNSNDEEVSRQQLKELKREARDAKEEAKEARRIERKEAAEAREARRALKAEQKAQRARKRADRLARRAAKK